MMKDFEQKVQNGVVIEVVNLTRPTFNDAQRFKNILIEDIVEKKFRKVIIDISQCDFIDSTFLGSMIVAKKKMNEVDGELKVVEPSNSFDALLERTPILDIMEPHKSLEKAILSFK